MAFRAVVNRREFLSLGLAAGAVRASVPETARVFLLPLYDRGHKTVAQEFLDGVSAALEKTYLVKVSVSASERYDGPGEGDAVLDFLYPRGGHVMAVMSGPLRAPVRNGIESAVTDVLGWADVPNDQRDRPRGSVITTHGLWNLREGDAIDRLGLIGIHELGHNFGAWDCPGNTCLMSGQIDLGRGVIRRTFCNKHRQMLWPYLR